MQVRTAADLLKLVNSALSSTKKAEDGDAAEESRTLEILKILKKWDVTAALLKETEAGKRVSKLTKSDNRRIADGAADVVHAWKMCVKNQSQLERSSSFEKSSSQGAGSLPAAQRAASSGVSGLSALTVTLHPAKSGNQMRDKIRMLLAEALAQAVGDVPASNPSVMAVEVEQAMFEHCGKDVNSQYKSKYRTLAANLKDPNNPDLRVSVLSGAMSAAELVNASVEQLASKQKQKEKDEIMEKMLREAERGQTTAASTDQFQCGRCKARKTTYYQMQTRSADEPMTTFVTCTNCNNRWKFC